MISSDSLLIFHEDIHQKNDAVDKKIEALSKDQQLSIEAFKLVMAPYMEAEQKLLVHNRFKLNLKEMTWSPHQSSV